MGGESSGSSSLDVSDSDMGSQRELINISGAQLYLIDGEESVLMQSGEFSLTILKQTHSPLAVVVANVGEVQWPVGKDAPVLKVFHRRYTFALPGLVYGMILPDSAPPTVIQELEAILAEYCTFETHHEIAKAGRVMRITFCVTVLQRQCLLSNSFVEIHHEIAKAGRVRGYDNFCDLFC